MNERDKLRLARAYLLRVAEPPAPALVTFIEEVGPVEAARRVRLGECPPKVVAETLARRELSLAEHDVVYANNSGARLVIPEDEEWPSWSLSSLSLAASRGVSGMVPPIALWVRGDHRLDVLTQQAVAIVGSRAATQYGEIIAADFGNCLAQRGITVFSGAAYGIDAAAHRGALAADGCTAAVVGCGLDVSYPAGHVNLLAQIAKNGLVISEYPPGTRPARHRFLIRNRLIAALTEGTLVVEAGMRSGARNTAATAHDLAKVVMAVPGSVNSAMSAGCHAMIRDAMAVLVSSADHVLENVGPLGAGASQGTVNVRVTDGFDDKQLRVYESLATDRTKLIAELATDSGVSIPEIRAILPVFEIDGVALRDDAGWKRLAR